MRITVTLPDDLGRTLAEAARGTRRSRSEIVRAALVEHLQRRPADRVRGLIDSLASGIPDLAERHREYVLESLRRGR